jgi:hypothetical protein
MNRFDEIEKDLKKHNRDKKSELIQNLKKIDIEPLTDFQRENITKFLKLIGEDELVDYLLGLLDTPNKKVDTPNTKKFLKQFADVLRKTKQMNQKNQTSLVQPKQ